MWSKDSHVNFRVVRVILDATDASALFDCETDVAIFTPVSGPGVLDNPVLGTVFFSVTDKEDSMVHLASTSLAIENTLLVVHDVGFNGNCHWTMLAKSGFHAVRSVSATSVSGSSLDFGGFVCIIFAFTILACVRVGLFGHDVMFLEE